MGTPGTRDGIRATMPLLAGVVPFAILVGLTAVERGFSILSAVGSSVLVFAGASQLAVIDLVDRGVPWIVVLSTALLINTRMLMYGAALGPTLADQPLRRRALGAHVLVDFVYALAAIRFQAVEEDRDSRWGYYSVVGLVLWAAWVLGTFFGALLGDVVPPHVPMDFAMPLMFMSLLVVAGTDRATVAASVMSAGVAAVTAPLPAGLGLFLAAGAGVAAGTAVSLRSGA